MFWLVATVLVVCVLAVLLWPLLTGSEQVLQTADLDVQVYRDQLLSLDDEIARGVISQEQAKTSRVEISRRILAADKRAQSVQDTASAGNAFPNSTAAVVALAVIGGTGGLYLAMGTPYAPDQPLQARLNVAKEIRSQRPNQSLAEADAPQSEVAIDEEMAVLLGKLRAEVSKRPEDQQGLRLLARNEANIGRFGAARAAQEQLVDVLGPDALGADYRDLAQYMIFAAGGYVSPEAEDALSQALTRDVRDPVARYFSGLALAQNGRPDVAYRMWLGLLEEGPADAPWINAIRARLPEVARAAGIETASPDAPGSDAEDINNARDLSVEDRAAMIEGMVAGLADRLSANGGTAEEWARLIRAYGVLNRTEEADQAWQTAKDVFEEGSTGRLTLRKAAEDTGLLK